MNRYYSTHEAARLLGVSLPTIVNWIKARRLRCHRTPGGHRRIAREDLAAFMLRHGMPLAAELSDAAPPRRKVLVVGELGPAREGVALQLAQGGWSAEVTSPGFAAGATLARYQPHVVVLLAPRADGGETLAALRADREAGATPVVAVGHADWRASLLTAGASAALARPLAAGALAAAVDAAVGGVDEDAPPPEHAAGAMDDPRPAPRRKATPRKKAR
ncbi:MAG: excisionase family DNA-binding protein [Anaeromyxobacter sp.]|nr:excisionase family DNA-binding protein [Anaeromyxobacter sp.]